MNWITPVVSGLTLCVSLSCAAQDSGASNAAATDLIVPSITGPEFDEESRLLTGFTLLKTDGLTESVFALIQQYLTVLNRPAQPTSAAELRLLRFSVSRELTSLLATEGYFSAQIDFVSHVQAQQNLVDIVVQPGPLTITDAVALSFAGAAVPADLQDQIRSSWSLPRGAVFRDEDWNRAKNNALTSLTDQSYAAARISDSQAVVQDELADLSVALDSGPVFHIGALQVTGLQRYQPWLLERYHPPEPGTLYSRAGLLKFQRELQNSPYFSTVTVSTDPEPTAAAALPVDVQVTERPQHDIGLGAGYSTNTGARSELSYRDRNFNGQAVDLRSVIRIEQLRQVGYADLYLPPRTSGYLDSLGILGERDNISGLVTSTSSFGARRVISENDMERRFGLSYIFEKSSLDGGQSQLAKALVSSVGWTRRKVDNAFQPRSGYVAQLDINGAAKTVLSDQNFVRFDGKFQQWLPVSARDVFIARIEAGYILAPSSDGIPETYLFRAGGTGSVRGYSYQSLGVNQAGGVAGGRVMLTATAEYVHWLEGNWGMAVFVDAGDAADRLATLRINQGIGAGVRFRTPAGPLALDLAYGREVKKFRLDFSVGIAF